ncbi:hypothetical protein [Labedella phragmitis]|uniref:hypothetical protein n=1 Tax=Labedella phragmitis TaxID=2498849 RepID=UPI001FB5BD14|nr:hypothetical protein [Labedella phragmitis]
MPEQKTCSPQNGSSAMTSNTPDHETSPHEDQQSHDGIILDGPSSDDSTVQGDAGDDVNRDDVAAVAADPSHSIDGAAPADPGVPAEPVQPTSPADVYDGSASAASTSALSSNDDLSGEEREPYPIGATDAEPSPATEGPGGEEIVVDYGAYQEPDTEPGADERPLTKPSPEEDFHPYPPQALGDPSPASSGAGSGSGAAAVAAVAAGSAGSAASTHEADRDRSSTTERIARDRDDRAVDTRTASDRDAADRSDGAAQRPVYVQAPAPPKKKGNRGFGVLVGVLATAVFGALYFVALLLTPLLSGTAVDYAASAMTILTSAAFFVPVIVFFLAWVLLIVVLTRAPWWGYVIGGFVVAIITYAGALGGALIQNAFEVAPSQVPSFLLAQALTPAAVLAFIVAREVPIWFGVWVGKRGRSVRARNIEAREEYERVLEAGPAARA